MSTDIDPQKIQVYFFDTADLQLFNTYQVILRGRSKAGKADDSTVKLRRLNPEWTFSEWREAKGEFKVEGDWVGDKIIRSASFSAEREDGLIERVEAGKESIDKLFTKEQEQFLKAATNSDINLDSLKVLGPAEVHKWKQRSEKINEEICLEYWQLANPHDVLQEKKEILEVSVKVDCDRAQAVWEHFNTFLEQHGIDPGGKQVPKTSTTLDFFASLIQTGKFQ